MQFTPLKDFFSEELQSSYCAGLSYTVRPTDTLLAQLVPQWITEGKVRPGPPAQHATGKANVSGAGEIT